MNDSLRTFKISIALCLGSFIVFCNLYSVQAILPYLSNEFEISETRVNWLFAATTLGLSLSLVPWAVVSDRLGRRPVLLFSLFTIPLINLSMLFVSSFEALVVVRALLGIVLAAFAGVAVAYLLEELEKSDFGSVMGFYIAANSLGGISGRVLGGIINEHLGWQSLLLTLAFLSLSGALFVFFCLPKQLNFKRQGISLAQLNRGIAYHCRDYKVWFGMLIGALNFALFVNLYTVVMFRLSAPPFEFDSAASALFFICYLAGTISSGYSGFWSNRHSPALGMMLGGILAYTGMLLTSSNQLIFIVLGLLLISLGGFFTHSLAYAWVNQKATRYKTSVGALYLVHYYIGGSIGGFILLYFWQHYQWSGVILAASTLFAMLLFLAWRLRIHEKYPVTPSINGEIA